MLNKSKGFTLIELLMVIAIIGILSSIALAVLNNARSKATDAEIKSNLSSARGQAELFYNSTGNNTYTNVCQTGTSSIAMFYNETIRAGSADVDCSDDNNEWGLSAQLKSNPALYFCTDYKGAATTTTGAIVAGIASATDDDIDCD